MLLEQQVAVVYGAGGAIGGAIARAFAAEGARVFLAGRGQESLERVAQQVHASGGQAETAVLDALDEQAVDGFVDDVTNRTGRLDISCNVIGYGDVQQPLMEITVADFLQPITTAARAHFLTTRAAARHMIPQRSGVILAFGGSGPQTLPGLGGFKVALDAVEAMRRQWATELGEHGIRVLSLKSGGVPEGIPETYVSGPPPSADQVPQPVPQVPREGAAGVLAQPLPDERVHRVTQRETVGVHGGAGVSSSARSLPNNR